MRYNGSFHFKNSYIMFIQIKIFMGLEKTKSNYFSQRYISKNCVLVNSQPPAASGRPDRKYMKITDY